MELLNFVCLGLFSVLQWKQLHERENHQNHSWLNLFLLWILSAIRIDKQESHPSVSVGLLVSHIFKLILWVNKTKIHRDLETEHMWCGEICFAPKSSVTKTSFDRAHKNQHIEPFSHLIGDMFTNDIAHKWAEIGARHNRPSVTDYLVVSGNIVTSFINEPLMSAHVVSCFIYFTHLQHNSRQFNELL